ncbi:SRPBCC family protein [Microlunatus soli]|uniref:Uncharacterized conserved protein YndB, AHSA1/START domain n=1 Tax=Microlunatus soli TaxID=630515 RepID=A0A1H1X7M0_9ACTN|nr:hypothetical protein [Microlunatus soli]SDT05314.1 Uncharacterized conserved protein YndB, AHSA1/START domain [Microlunatus soli]
MTDVITDAIEDSIEIDATAEQVWPLISEPGWWINDGSYREHLIEERDGLVIVTDAAHGAFPIATVAADEPRYVAFRWLTDSEDPHPDGPGTTTEFWVEDRPGGVTLKVRESGFATLPGEQADILRQIDGNTSGWRTELAVAKSTVEDRRRSA